MFGGKLGDGSEKTFFFGLHLMFGGKLDVGRREGLVEMCLTVTFKQGVEPFKISLRFRFRFKKFYF